MRHPAAKPAAPAPGPCGPGYVWGLFRRSENEAPYVNCYFPNHETAAYPTLVKGGLTREAAEAAAAEMRRAA